ncbi:MAG: hypothetical protein LBK06_03875, partial [Planctomycetaceae bacterium]|nr:hypothetical protein [Planctomycetaceae bacterium]
MNKHSTMPRDAALIMFRYTVAYCLTGFGIYSKYNLSIPNLNPYPKPNHHKTPTQIFQSREPATTQQVTS